MLSNTVKMLVADDSRTVQMFFRKIVERWRWPIELVTADNGRECMNALAQGDIDLAFVDVNMPEMSGMEAVSRARFSGAKTFITLMSGKASGERFEVARQIRAYEYLVKPFTEAQVEDVIRTHRRISLRHKTLIVDDNKTIRTIIRRVLERSIFNLAIEEAGSGERALKFFADASYDIVFLDCYMPGLDGLATLEQLLARDRMSKIIMISAERNGDTVRTAMEKGAVAFLHKPFFGADIDRALHTALGLRMPDLSSGEVPAARAPALCPADDTSMQDGATGDEALEWRRGLAGDASSSDASPDGVTASAEKSGA